MIRADVNQKAKRDIDAMFDGAEAWMEGLMGEFVVQIATMCIQETPGFEIPGTQYGGQHPDTDYQPTGRLRGGWNWTVSPINTSSKGMFAGKGEEGPFDGSARGETTIAHVREQLPAKLPTVSWLENDVGYGDLVWKGEGAHIGRARPWTEVAYNNQKEALQKALTAMGGR